MKNSLLIGINAKYIHSNLAIRYIQKYVEQQHIDNYEHVHEKSSITFQEFSINQDLEYILDEIMKTDVDIIGFSCYLWNIEMVRRLSRNIKLIRPKVCIVYGGPEVTYTSVQELEENPYVDIVVKGEGEKIFADIVKNFDALSQVKGISYRQEDQIIDQPCCMGMDFSEVIFPYEPQLDQLEHRIIYYETSRGCPFNCQYCLSSVEKGVRFRPLALVKKELQFFIDAKVTQVKLVDRTFNAKREHALSIMEYIMEKDQGITNFHFEVAPELIDEAFLTCLAKAREGLFQLEIGVQSSNSTTLSIIKRKNDLELIPRVVERVKALSNTHIHLDLIAGLPEEDLKTFKDSFDYVYAMEPDQFQLGFLKILKGAGLYYLAKEYKIKYRDYPPYEVLSTRVLPFEDVMQLKRVEEMVETFYNSGLFNQTIKRLVKEYSRSYNLYEALGAFWIKQGMHHVKHNKLGLYQFIYAFIQQLECTKDNKDIYVQWLQMDYIFNEKPKKKADWMTMTFVESTLQRYLLEVLEQNQVWQEEAKEYTTKQLSRMYHIDRIEHKELFSALPFRYQIDAVAREGENGTYILVNYGRRDFIHNNGELVCINLE